MHSTRARRAPLYFFLDVAARERAGVVCVLEFVKIAHLARQSAHVEQVGEAQAVTVDLGGVARADAALRRACARAGARAAEGA